MWIISWGLKALPYLKSPKAAASIVGIVAALGLYLYVGHLQNKVEDQKEARILIASYYDQCQKANVKLQLSNRTLQGANESLAAAVRISEDERVAAVQEAAERAARAEAELDDTLDNLEDLRNETPSCAELSKIDMGAVCPAVTERLREHAAGTIDRD